MLQICINYHGFYHANFIVIEALAGLSSIAVLYPSSLLSQSANLKASLAIEWIMNLTMFCLRVFQPSSLVSQSASLDSYPSSQPFSQQPSYMAPTPTQTQPQQPPPFTQPASASTRTQLPLDSAALAGSALGGASPPAAIPMPNQQVPLNQTSSEASSEQMHAAGQVWLQQELTTGPPLTNMD